MGQWKGERAGREGKKETVSNRDEENIYREWKKKDDVERELDGSVREVGDPRKNVREAQGRESQEAFDHVTKKSKKMNTGERPLDLGFTSKEAIEKSFFDFPGDLVVKIPHFHCTGRGFVLWWGKKKKKRVYVE